MTVIDIPIISFFQRVLDPIIIMGSLYICSMVFGEPFSGYALVLMILAFFISSAVYQHIDPYRTWRSGRMLAYVRDTVFGWAVTVAVLIFLGNASGLHYYYDEKVMLTWFIATPIALLLSHMVVRSASLGKGQANSEVRSVLIVGANDVGIKFAKVCERHPNLFMKVEGFFDDRADERHPAGLSFSMGTYTAGGAMVETEIKYTTRTLYAMGAHGPLLTAAPPMLLAKAIALPPVVADPRAALP